MQSKNTLKLSDLNDDDLKSTAGDIVAAQMHVPEMQHTVWNSVQTALKPRKAAGYYIIYQ